MTPLDTVEIAEPLGAFGGFDDHAPSEDEIAGLGDYTGMWSPAIRGVDLGAWKPPADIEICPKILYKGGITLLAGAAKAGKSTMTWNMCDAVANGKRFLDMPTTKTRVLYVTEQSKFSLYTQLRRDAKAVLSNPSVYFLLIEHNCRFRPKTDTKKQILMDEFERPLQQAVSLKTWDEQVDFWAENLVKTKAGVLVIDTAMTFMHLRDGEINDTGVVQSRIAEMKTLFGVKPDLAILLIHHVRKTNETGSGKKRSDQDDADILGSQAFAAGPDQLLTYTKADPSYGPTARFLKVTGRYTSDSERIPVYFENGQYTTAQKNTFDARFVEAVDADPTILNRTQAELATMFGVSQTSISRARKSLGDQ